MKEEEAEREYGLALIQQPGIGAYDAVVVAVAHDIFFEMCSSRIRLFGSGNHVLFDLKYIFLRVLSDLRL